MSGSVVIPSFRYKDAQAAIGWLEKAFGFVRKAVYAKPDGTVEHAELTFGETGMIMLGSASNASPYPDRMGTPEALGGVTSPMYLIVKDCEPVYASAMAAGAKLVMELRTMDYGGKAFTVADPEGYVWAVGEYDPWKSSE